MGKKFVFEGEIFYEVLEMNGRKYEHAGFRDSKGEFEKALFSLVSKDKPRVPVRLIIEVLE